MNRLGHVSADTQSAYNQKAQFRFSSKSLLVDSVGFRSEAEKPGIQNSETRGGQPVLNSERFPTMAYYHPQMPQFTGGRSLPPAPSDPSVIETFHG